MRIVIDLQGIQANFSQTERDGLLVLLKKMNSQEVMVVLNAAFPESTFIIRKAIEPFVPQTQIQVLELFFEKETPFFDNPQYKSALEAIYEHFIQKLHPDMLLLINPFEIQTRVVPRLNLSLENITIAFNKEAMFSWETLTKKLLSAQERPKKTVSSTKNISDKPRLAYVSPMPPDQTGIASYSATLLPELSHDFDIDVISDHPLIESLHAFNLKQRSIAWFEANGASYEQVLYHMGNSPFHTHMYDLLKLYPGVVVLHDFFLSHMLAHEDLCKNRSYIWLKALLSSHGYFIAQSYLKLTSKETVEQLMSLYPCNWEVLQNAKGIIVQSQAARLLAEHWYGREVGEDWAVIPLLSNAPASIDRFAARTALGISEEAFVVCTFGLIHPSKCIDPLVNAWLASKLSKERHCELVFVGNNPPENDISRLSELSVTHKIRVTGWCSDRVYQQYLQAADLAVQLRSHSRGETSKAVLDCMSYGLPVILNMNGSMAELPVNSVWALPDAFTEDALQTALEVLWENPEKRALLGKNAYAHIVSHHHPKACASLYKEAIETFSQNTAMDIGALVKKIAAIIPNDFSMTMLQQLAQSIAVSFRPKIIQKQLLVDVTAISNNDLKGGIERVVRAQLLALMKHPPAGFRVEPIYLSCEAGEWRYRYAQNFAFSMFLMDELPPKLEEMPVDVNSGDIFYAPDYAPHAVTAAAKSGLYLRWRALGVQINILVHDLLPVSHPQFFVEGSDKIHADWLLAMAQYADRVIGVSSSVAQMFCHWLSTQNLVLTYPLKVTAVLHGADIAASGPSAGLPKKAKAVLKELQHAVTFLMVGTIEPRKGHLLALEAMEILWKNGVAVKLVIVGKEGWKNVPENKRRTIPGIITKLKNHPEKNKQLFWIKNASDEYLEALYAASTCLLVPSEGEGFGLPLIEAAHHKLPIIARDLPVFREVAQDHATYFQGSSAHALADAIKLWLEAYHQDKVPRSTQMKWSTWAENVERLKSVLLGYAEEQGDLTEKAWGTK